VTARKWSFTMRAEIWSRGDDMAWVLGGRSLRLRQLSVRPLCSPLCSVRGVKIEVNLQTRRPRGGSHRAR
jgi:hypothetical protein